MNTYAGKTSEALESLKNLDPSVTKLFTNLLECYIEEYKERLVGLKGEERDEMQGAIKKIRNEILAALTRKKLSIHREEFKSGGYNS